MGDVRHIPNLVNLNDEQRFIDDIRKIVNNHREKSNLSYAQVVGIIEIVKLELMTEKD